MKQSERAKYEVELAKKKVMEDEDDFNEYLYACFDSALEAFEVLCKRGHSGISIEITKDILNKLIDGEPLTAIEDTPDVWDKVDLSPNDNAISYQCKRCSALFKKVFSDGTVKYEYVDSATGIDAITGATYSSGLIRSIYDEMYPIKMPFVPPKDKAYIYTADFLFDKESVISDNDIDTVVVLYIQKGDKRTEVNRFFRVPDIEIDDFCTYPGWVEIDINEFTYRMQTAKARGNTNMVLDDIGLEELYNKYMKEKGYSSKKTGG